MQELWYQALHSPHGIEIQCSDIASVRARLYKIRKDLCDSDLDVISICVSPFDPTRLWLVKRSTPDETS